VSDRPRTFVSNIKNGANHNQNRAQSESDATRQFQRQRRRPLNFDFLISPSY